LRIGIAFDLAPVAASGEGPDDRFEEFDRPETIEAIADVIRGEGHEAVLLGDGRALLGRVLDDPPDFVFNLAEGEGISRCREARVPAVLEMLGIPYSGSDPLTLSATLDKGVAKRLLPPDVPAPRGWEIIPGADCESVAAAFEEHFRSRSDAGPLILKPSFEGSSKGIRADCLADDAEGAMALFGRLAQDYRQTILVEEFIAGDEVTVGLIGNGPGVEPLGAMRILPVESAGRFVYSLEVKRNWAERVRYEAPAIHSDEIAGWLFRAARSAFGALGCRDVARIDFRVRDGVPYFLEANPLPGLSPSTSDLVFLARGHGIGHEELIRRILRVALARVGLGNGRGTREPGRPRPVLVDQGSSREP
jgi:D-alanine-D-alanine ligase